MNHASDFGYSIDGQLPAASRLLDRTDYERMETGELERRLRQARDLKSRSPTVEAALADAFAEQELEAVLLERGVG